MTIVTSLFNCIGRISYHSAVYHHGGVRLEGPVPICPFGGRGQGDKSWLPIYPCCVFRGVGVEIQCWCCVVGLCGVSSVNEELVGGVSLLVGGGWLDASTLMSHPSGVRQYRSVATCSDM